MSGDPSAMVDASDSGDKQKGDARQQAADGSAIPLAFPSTLSDPAPHLAPLRDNHSNYAAVCKTCLLLNQFSVNGSSAVIEDSTCIESSSVFHDGTFVSSLSESFAALLECIGQHDDRRARIIACKTAALVARATYARLRHWPHLFAIRDAANNRLEDEVGTDVPMALCTAALEDPDDGVAASAMNSLGILILSSSATPGTLVEDELLSEVLSIVNAGNQPSPYAPGLRDLVDEDTKTPQTELQLRIFDNVLSPRLLQLVARFLAFESHSHIASVLPTLTASLVYLSKTAPRMIYPLDRATYSKRWVELDYVSLIDDVVEGLLFPLMKSNSGVSGGGSQVGHVAALSAIRLIHACPSASWVREAAEWAVLILKEEYGNTTCLETKLTMLASLVVVSRVIPLPERTSAVFDFIVDCLQGLPSTTAAPHGTVSAGLLLEFGGPSSGSGKGGRTSGNGGGIVQFRKPSRPAFWAEIALGFFMDGPVECVSGDEAKARSHALVKFLKSPKILAILKDGGEVITGSGSKLREELVTAFCMVAFQVGRRHKCPEEGGGPHLAFRQDELEEWVRMAGSLLKSFGPCIGWGDSPPYMEEEMTMLVACQAAYTRLLQEVLHGAGLLGPSSVTLKMTPFSAPPNILWDQMEEASEYLVEFEHMPPMETMVDPFGKLMDDIVKKEMKGLGIISHHMRLFLMSLAADQWVHARYIASQKGSASGDSSSEIAMNIDSAKQILIAISPRRMFSKVVESNKSQVETYSKSKKEKYKKFAQDMVTACVACIENMALMTCDYTKKFGNSADTKTVLNLSVQALQGKLGSDSDAPVLPVCQGAIERIQAAFQSGNRTVKESIPLSPLVPTDFKRRQVISSARITQGRDAFHEGYLMQLSRQIISSRADRCIMSFPSVNSFPSAVRKQNWLRLSLPPLPRSRNPQMSVVRIPRFAWGSNVSVCTTASDPLAVSMAYSVRRNMRYDGADEFRLMVAMRVHNLAAVEVPNGLRLELGITEECVSTSADAQDSVSFEIVKSLSEDSVFGAAGGESMFGSAVVIYSNELKGGDHITWEVTLNPLPMTGAITLKPAIMYRGIDKEPPHAAWVTADSKREDEDTSVTSGFSQKSGGSKAESDGGDDAYKPGKEQKDNIIIPGEPMYLSPMVGLQPCPLVFFRDGCGDVDSFRFLWSRMPCQLTPIKLIAFPESEETPPVSFDSLRLAAISTVKFGGDPVPGGMITRLWSFMSPHGKRAMFVLAEQGNDKGKTLHVRGDEKQLLLCLTGTSTARNALISALQPGLKPFHQDVFT